jgi:hypothetical protein
LLHSSRPRSRDWRTFWALLLLAIVGFGWLNQGASIGRYARMRDDVEGSHRVTISAWARLSLAFLYRRSSDEELYYATAEAMQGKPFDRTLLLTARGPTPSEFARLPPPDGHFHAPYAEVALEYPPLVLPFILLPSLVTSSFESFARAFGVLMAACLVLAVALCIGVDPSATPAWKRERWWLASALFVAQGGLAIQRLDAVLALFLALSLWSAARQKPTLFGVAIGLSIGVKFLPALWLPPVVAVDRRVLGRSRAVMKIAAGLALGLVIGFGPMLLLSARALPDLLAYHAARGLQVESTLGLVLNVIRAMAGHAAASTLSFGSYNLGGADADFAARLSTPLMVGLIGVWSWHLSRPRDLCPSHRTDALAIALLGGCVAVWLSGKVFSPQYLTWAIPLVLALSEKAGRRIIWLLVAAMGLTQLYHRGYYDYVADARFIGLLTLLIRQGVLVAVGALLWRRAANLGTIRQTSDALS